jgi:hypothetical protein
MANEKRDIMALPINDLTAEELQLRVLRTQANREILNLEDAEETQKRNANAKVQRHIANTQRQSELAQIAAMQRAIQNGCRHRQGGHRHRLYSGDGKPLITKCIMLDGVTAFYQCARCRLKFYTPHPALRQRDPAEYAKQRAFADKLEELHQESGLDHLKTPNFTWTKDGVPFLPERAGA